MNTAKVVRFNWPKYLGALAVATAALAAAGAGVPGWIRYPLWVACVPAVTWTVTSVAATWWVYDHRNVYQRLAVDLPAAGVWAAVHAGYDDSVPVLSAMIGRPPAAVAQIPVRPGASLRRARKLDRRVGPDGLPAGRIAIALRLPAATLSFHLKELKHAGLVTCLRDGRSLVYAANFDPMAGLMGFLGDNCCGGRPELCLPSSCASAKEAQRA